MFPRAVLCCRGRGIRICWCSSAPTKFVDIYLLEWEGLKFLVFWVPGKAVGTISVDPYRSPFMKTGVTVPVCFPMLMDTPECS